MLLIIIYTCKETLLWEDWIRGIIIEDWQERTLSITTYNTLFLRTLTE